MRTDDIPIDDNKKPEPLEKLHRTPVSSLTTTGITGYLGRFRIDITIISPVAEEAQRPFSLTRSEAQDILEAVTDIIELLKE